MLAHHVSQSNENVNAGMECTYLFLNEVPYGAYTRNHSMEQELDKLTRDFGLWCCLRYQLSISLAASQCSASEIPTPFFS